MKSEQMMSPSTDANSVRRPRGGRKAHLLAGLGRSSEAIISFASPRYRPFVAS